MNLMGKLTGLAAIVLLTFFMACEEEEETNETMENQTLTVEDQIVSQNMIEVQSAEITLDNGWIVVHKDDGGSPQTPDIITEPVQIRQGVNENIKLEIKSDVSVSDGETLWVMIHEDTGEENSYEFGEGDLDPPVTVDGSPLTKQIAIIAPKIMASDQALKNKTANISEIVAGTNGWVVVHKDNGSGAPGAVLGHSKVSEGITQDLQVQLTDTLEYTHGMDLYPMLHVDKGNMDEYEFPGADVPEIFGNETNNIVLTSFMVDTTTTSSADTTTIDISGNAFNPSSKTISEGTTVKWVNNDGYAHTVTSDNQVFSSGNINGGDSYTYTFNSTGTYDYHCTIHTTMTGSIVVE